MTQPAPLFVDPPKRTFRRPRRSETFEKLFNSLEHHDGSPIYEPWEVPKDADGRYWWTVLDCDGRLLLAAGFHFVNRIGYIKCERPWGGEWSDHPEYFY